MTKQKKLEETALVEDAPSKRVKRKAEENNASAAKEEEAPPAKDNKSEHHATAGKGDMDPQRPLEGDQPKGELEEGRIFFLYRPRVGLPDAESVSDIQRLYMVLAPTARPAGEGGGPAAQPKPKARLVVVAKKVLPDPGRHERFFGFVAAVSDSVEDLIKGLGPNEHETKTMGTRRQEAARVVGEGVYSIVQSGSRNTHLLYRLEVPEEPGEVQQELRIFKEGKIVISVKNPTKRNPPGAGLGGSQKAEFPKDKMEEFEGGPPGGYAWIPATDPSLLDFPHCELLLIGAKPDAQGVDAEVKEHLKEAEEADHEGDADDKALLERLRHELHADMAGVKIDPAATGNWA
ncbi:hypothetical protein WJX81_001710 [Elliptochloris bilobata]|uniref:Uncharacterized protein n=1 Tax=Elliptochloris bilobata TaxID=381761 RepID=A0AAW1QII9_9CHLO